MEIRVLARHLGVVGFDWTGVPAWSMFPRPVLAPDVGTRSDTARPDAA